jgi:uncharacterized protein YvpB
MQKINVPYFSQYQDVEEEHWKSRSCGITSVKMVLNYLKPKNKESIDELIEEGILIGGYGKDGWNHEGLLRIFRNRGISAHRDEFRSVLVDTAKRKFLKSTHESSLIIQGFEKIKKYLIKELPVIVSVDKSFDENKEHHLIVLTGFEEDKLGEIDGFYYNDPDAKVGVKKDKFVSLEKFEKYWRRLAIFVENDK